MKERKKIYCVGKKTGKKNNTRRLYVIKPSGGKVKLIGERGQATNLLVSFVFISIEFRRVISFAIRICFVGAPIARERREFVELVVVTFFVVRQKRTQPV